MQFTFITPIGARLGKYSEFENRNADCNIECISSDVIIMS